MKQLLFKQTKPACREIYWGNQGKEKLIGYAFTSRNMLHWSFRANTNSPAHSGFQSDTIGHLEKRMKDYFRKHHG